MSSNSSKSSNIQHTYLYAIRGQKTTRQCLPTRQSQVTYTIRVQKTTHPTQQSQVTHMKHIKGQKTTGPWRPTRQSQVNLYTIRGHKTTRPCRPTRQSQVTYNIHIFTQSEARRQLVRVVQLVKVKLLRYFFVVYEYFGWNAQTCYLMFC